MLPSLALLEQIQQRIKNIPNRQGEYKQKIHYCCFLLCCNSGLRISEAVKFDLSARTKKGLHRINKPKGKKKRYVYIPPQIINELKAHNWQPNQTNRFNFYHFLKSIKKELGIPSNVELTPHTLRRAFATYHAEAGLPLPLLSKLLGHESVRTTALYWMNIYNEDDDSDDILTGKVWLKKPRWKLKPESEAPIRLNLGELPEPLAPNSLASEPRPNYLTKISQLEWELSQIQRKKDEKITELTREKETLQNDLANLSEQNATLQHEKSQIQQDLATATETIKQLTQELTNERGQKITAENNLVQEKQVNTSLRQQLQIKHGENQTLQETNANLTQKIQQSEQIITNKENAYQITLKDKQIAEKQLIHFAEEIKTFAKTLAQWQKINHYQQLEKQNRMEAKIVQREPPPWKTK